MKNINNVFWCKNCLVMSTRPRIKFENGICSACDWYFKKKKMDWSKRKKELINLLDNHRNKRGNFDCIVPVSGGKDGSYVCYNLKNIYNMNPLSVTVTPALPLKLGDKNLRAFVNSGFTNISINLDYKAMQKLNKYGLINKGFPYYGWLIAIHTSILHFAKSMKIKLIFYGEDGEVEYGGSTETQDKAFYDFQYQKKIYLENGYDRLLESLKLNSSDYFYFKYPEDDSFFNELKITHWSYYENWDPYRNYIIAKEHCGLSESDETNSGTFTNFAQNDQALYALHTFIMYIKFGFGRANQDASIEIRRGAMNRDQAINLVNLYDGIFPQEYLKDYLDYFEMTESDFFYILQKWTNKTLFDVSNNKWHKKFEIQ